jgi:hypothetical protein
VTKRKLVSGRGSWGSTALLCIVSASMQALVPTSMRADHSRVVGCSVAHANWFLVGCSSALVSDDGCSVLIATYTR